MNQEREKIAVCGCGKTAEEHESSTVLTWHHYWYFHKKPMKGCRICEMETEYVAEELGEICK